MPRPKRLVPRPAKPAAATPAVTTAFKGARKPATKNSTNSPKTSPATTFSEDAKRVRAEKELLELSEWRLIAQAVEMKTPQQQIATALGTSQSTISRVINRIANDPTILELSPSEIINRHTAGLIDTQTMLETLLRYAYTPGQFDPTGGDGFIAGDWQQIEDAFIAGLITKEQYEQIALEAPSKDPSKVV